MVHPKVLAGCGLDPKSTAASRSASAWSASLCAALLISDLRMFFENDTRFLSQF